MIRPLREPDASVLIEIWYEATKQATPFLDDDFLHRERQEIVEVWLPMADTWLFDDGDGVAGFIALVGDDVGGLFVHPDRQGGGVGRTLTDHALALRGTLELDVFEQNHGARRFYERYGFREIGRHTHEGVGREQVRLTVDRPESWGEGTVDRYLSRAAAHRVDESVDLLTEDFTLAFAGSPARMDRSAAVHALGWDAGANGRLAWRVLERSESAVRVEGREGNDFLDLLSFGEIDFHSTYALSPEGLIAGYEYDADWAGRDLAAAMAPLLAWASTSAPDELSELRPEGRMIYSRETAVRWVVLARRWRDETGGASRG